MSKNYQKPAEEIIQYIGGKENIITCAHCVTRLRFTVKDKGLINVDDLEKVDGVVGTTWLGDQFQIIIGKEVDNYYQAVCKEAGIEPEHAINENLDTDLTKKKWSLKGIGNAILAYLSPTMTGLLPILATACLLKTVGYLIGPDVLNIVAADSGIYITLDFMYDAFFYFIPMFLGYSAAKALNLDPVYGIYLGAILLAPDFVNLIGTMDSLSIFGIPCPIADYSNSFLPVILGVWICSLVYKLMDRIIPNLLKSLCVPLLTMIIMAPIMFGICAPLGSYLGNIIGNFFIFLAQGNIILRILGGILLGMALPFMVITGMHGALVTFAVMILAQNGFETLITPTMYVYNYAVFGVALGAFLKIKNTQVKNLTLEYFVTCVLGGVTEPVLYGVIIKFKRTILPLLIAGAVGGAYVGIMAPKSYMMTTVSIIGVWTQYVQGGMANFISGVASLAIAFIVGCIGAYMVSYED
jgi:PTS system beta-glucosides-specific IIC component